MKTKFLVSALTLSSCFVACNNEIVEMNSENASVPAEEIVGADLVSRGMTIKTNLDGVQSRANEQGWENDDRVGLAWYNVAVKTINKNAISAFNPISFEQNYTDWAGVVYGENTVTSGKEDNNIYNNILFNYVDGNFTTKANVYQGAYIGYFPHQYMSKVAPLSFNVQQEQTSADAGDEQYNKTLHISAQDFISADDVMNTDGVLESEFYLYPVANNLKVVATPVAKMMADELLKEMNITDVTIGNSTALFQIETGTINPWTVPAVQYEADGVTVDEEATKTLMDNWAATLGVEGEAVKSLSTHVADDVNLTLTEGRTVRLATLPTEAADGKSEKITVKVTSNGFAVGEFVINKNDANSKNVEAIEKLHALTTEVGYTASDKQNYSLRTIMRNAAGNAVAQNLKITLTAANFVPKTSSIKTLAQWNELVNVINAMYAIDKNITVPKFTLGANIEFVDGEIKVPACGVTVNTGKYKMIVASENVVWPNNIVPAVDKDENNLLNVEVKELASLYVNGTKKAPATLDAASIDNNGEIYANAYASISTKDGKALDNTDGRVIVEYGSYVYPADKQAGDIVFVVDENTKIAHVNVLIDGGKELLGNANVNTLIVRTELDLNAPATKSTADDRYFEGNDATSLTEKIKNINIELEGGSLVHVLEGANTTVANVKAASGENTINDVVVTNDMVVEEGATLNIEGILEPVAKTYVVKNVNNEGTLNVNVKTLQVTSNINNTNGGYIEVADECMVKYRGTFKQVSATYKGTIEKY